MDERLQRRIQRYGWDQAADRYETLWEAQLASTHRRLHACANLKPGQAVLDIACGSGLSAMHAASAVGDAGRVVGVDLSEGMINQAATKARLCGIANASFLRMDAECLDFPDAYFDVVICSLGLMYFANPARALMEMLRVLRPGGEVHLAVWGERQRCGWSGVFEVVAAEVSTEVCPLFFRLGTANALKLELGIAGFIHAVDERFTEWLSYSSPDNACDAALVGGPVAMAWSRFDMTTRRRVRQRYLEKIGPWRRGMEYEIPGEFLIASARRPANASDASTELN